MELRQLRYFVAVAETGNISRAAKAIFLTQSALSRQIKALEEELGQCLLERRAHSVHLTPAGEVMYTEAREILGRADLALERVKASGKAARLRIGYAPSLATGLLAPAVDCFKQVHADARVELADLATAEMLRMIATGELDAILTVKDPSTARSLRWTTLVRAPWRLAVRKGHPLAGPGRLAPAAIAAQPLLVFAQRDYPEYWATVTAWFRAHRLRPRLAGEHDGGESLVTAVASGLGVAFVTSLTAELFPTRVVYLTPPAPPPPLCIAVACRRDRAREKPLAVFIEELRRAAGGRG